MGDSGMAYVGPTVERARQATTHEYHIWLRWYSSGRHGFRQVGGMARHGLEVAARKNEIELGSRKAARAVSVIIVPGIVKGKALKQTGLRSMQGNAFYLIFTDARLALRSRLVRTRRNFVN